MNFNRVQPALDASSDIALLCHKFHAAASSSVSRRSL